MPKITIPNSAKKVYAKEPKLVAKKEKPKVKSNVVVAKTLRGIRR